MSSQPFLPVRAYAELEASWPKVGRHILASFDDASVVVYQAYNDAIASFALKHQRFGGPFSLSRMSWIKPNFLWMMFRSGWATKPDQTRVLAVRLQRTFFEALLRKAVPSTFWPEVFASQEAWAEAVRTSDVRLQWDPDHTPPGTPLARRAVQLGLRGATLAEYATSAIIEIIDATPTVEAERPNAVPPYERLRVPDERVFVPDDPAAARAIRLDPWPA